MACIKCGNLLFFGLQSSKESPIRFMGRQLVKEFGLGALVSLAIFVPINFIKKKLLMKLINY